MEKKELLGLSLPQLEDLFRNWGEPVYRGRQLYHALYREQQWDAAIERFQKTLSVRPNDPPSRAFIERCLEFQSKNPEHDGTSFPAPWNGVCQITAK